MSTIEFNDAIAKLKGLNSSPDSVLEYTIERLNTTLKFNKLQLSQDQEITRNSLGAANKSPESIITDVLKRLQVTDSVEEEGANDASFDFGTLNKFEHLLIFSMLKANNDFKLKLPCPKCETLSDYPLDFTVANDTYNYNQAHAAKTKLDTYSFTTSDNAGNDCEFVITIRMPIISDEIAFDKDKEKRLKTIKGTLATVENSDTMVDNLEYFIEEYEGNNLYIETITIDGDEVEGFASEPVGKRIKLLGLCPSSIMNEDAISKFDKYLRDSLTMDLICQKEDCEHDFKQALSIGDLIF